MDNVGDWLYIVFLIVAGVSGLFNAKNKKKQVKPVQQPSKEIPGQPEETTPERSFWDIFEEEEEEQPEKKPQEETPVTSKPMEPEQVPVAAPEQRIAEQTSLHHRPAPSLQEENNLSTDFDFNSAVELRKAVIYAEILNRKY